MSVEVEASQIGEVCAQYEYENVSMQILFSSDFGLFYFGSIIVETKYASNSTCENCDSLSMQNCRWPWVEPDDVV